MEISGGAALPTPEYVVYGSRGSLIGDGQTLRWKYLHPNVPLKDIKANPATPDGATFGNDEVLQWKEDSYALGGDKTDVVWDYFYEAYRNHKPYPITSDQAAEVVRVLEEAKIGTEFAQ